MRYTIAVLPLPVNTVTRPGEKRGGAILPPNSGYCLTANQPMVVVTNRAHWRKQPPGWRCAGETVVHPPAEDERIRLNFPVWQLPIKTAPTWPGWPRTDRLPPAPRAVLPQTISRSPSWRRRAVAFSWRCFSREVAHADFIEISRGEKGWLEPGVPVCVRGAKGKKNRGGSSDLVSAPNPVSQVLW